MPRVESYKIDQALSGKEFLLGTDVDENNKTRSYLLQRLAEFIANGGGDGLNGLNGVDGIPDGNGTYTWQKYATSISGEGITDIATLETLFIGFAWGKKSFIESDDAEDYTWFSIDDKNIYWTDESGNKHYTWLKYAESLFYPYGFSDEAVGLKYMGIGLDKLTPEPDQTDLTDQEWLEALEWHKVLSGNPVVGTNKFFWYKFGEDIDGFNIGSSIIGKTHIGIAYDKDDYLASESASDYIWGSLTGDNTDNEGEFTHLKFAITPSDSITDSPVNVQYIGFNFDNDTNVESTDYTVYKWLPLSFSDGKDGENGTDGGIVDGREKWTWIKFSAFEKGYDGTTPSMSDDPLNMTYMGIAINQEDGDESDEPLDYIWGTISGATSYIGPNGETLWIHTKYSDFEDGFDLQGDPSMFDLPTDLTYLGISYGNLTNVESEVPTDYEWHEFRGSGFLQEAVWTFLWIKYANKDEDGNIIDIDDSPAGKTWMGIGHDKPIPEESLDPDDYVWNHLVGPQGYIGPNGEDRWIWVKYSYNNPSDTLYTDPNEVDPEARWMGLAFNKDNPDMTNKWDDYTWYPVDFEGDGGGNDDDHIQNNKVRVINIPLSEITPVTTESIKAYLRSKVFEVSQDENLIFHIEDDVDPTGPINPTNNLLDQSLDLLLGEDPSVTRGETTITLKWDPQGDSNIKKYTLSVTPFGGTTVRYEDLDSGVLTRALTGLSAGTVYTAVVEAFGSVDTDFKVSDPFTFLMEYENVIPSFTLFSKTDTTATVDFFIADSFGVKSWNIYIVGDPNNVFASFNASDGYRGVITGLNPSTTYFMYIKAVDIDSNESDKSVPDLEIQTLDDINPPLTQTPTLSYESSKLRSLNVSVATDNIVEYARVDGFVFEYKKFTGPGFVWDGADLFVLNSSTSTYTDFKTAPVIQIGPNLDPSTVYMVRVKFSSGDQVSVWSNELKVSTTLERYTELSLNLAPYEEGLDFNSYTGHLYIYGGKPNTNVEFDIDLSIIQTVGSSAIGTLDFVNNPIYIAPTSIPTRVTVALDAYGRFFDVFNVESAHGGETIRVNVSLVSSVYIPSPTRGSDSKDYITINNGIGFGGGDDGNPIIGDIS